MSSPLIIPIHLHPIPGRRRNSRVISENNRWGRIHGATGIVHGRVRRVALAWPGRHFWPRPVMVTDERSCQALALWGNKGMVIVIQDDDDVMMTIVGPGMDVACL